MTLNPWLIIGLMVAALAIGAAGYAKGHGDANTAWEARTAAAQLASEQKARDTETAWRARLAALDAQHEKERRDAKALEDKLRADIDLGARKLRIAVSRNSVPGDPQAPGAGGSEDLELSPASRQAYHDLRASIIENRQTLDACQGYAEAISAAVR